MFQRIVFAVIASSIAVSQPLMAQDDLLWREVDPENIAVVELPGGTFMIELNPAFAPDTVKQFRELVRERFYDGLGFYRVIDGFVAQGR